MLTINNLWAATAKQMILRGVNLQVGPGEVHAIMGPNGSGKSTLANVLAGRSDYSVTDGSIEYFNENLLTMDPHQRAAKGLFLAFQYPVEIPGVNNLYFLRTALNSVRKQRGESELDAMDCIQLIKEKMALLGMDEKFLHRAVNADFSGGEKKRNEILQMQLFRPD